MKTKFLLTVIIAMFSIIQVNAQTHDNSKGACRLFKNSAVEVGAFCPACVAKDKKEQAARDAENKRRNDAVIAEANAKQKARELEIIKEKELAEKNKPKEVFVTIPKTNTINRTAPEKKAESKMNVMLKNYFYTEENDINNQSLYEMWKPKDVRNQNHYFIINNEKKFTNNEFKACIGSLWKHNEKNEFNFPPNVGIVVLNEVFIGNNGRSVQISDLIDSKGNRILNDNSISIIIHFADDYFIVFRGESNGGGSGNTVSIFTNNGESFIYNLKTKQKHPIPRYTIDGSEIRWYEFDFIVNLQSGQEIDKSKYKARFRSILSSTEYIHYFITQDGKLEEQIIKI